jgi:thioredoxin 1
MAACLCVGTAAALLLLWPSPAGFLLLPQYPQHNYAVAQVETMQQTVSSIRYTPTFAIYRNGKKVDEVIGKEPQKLQDHLWLQAD